MDELVTIETSLPIENAEAASGKNESNPKGMIYIHLC